MPHVVSVYIVWTLTITTYGSTGRVSRVNEVLEGELHTNRLHFTSTQNKLQHFDLSSSTHTLFHQHASSTTCPSHLSPSSNTIPTASSAFIDKRSSNNNSESWPPQSSTLALPPSHHQSLWSPSGTSSVPSLPQRLQAPDLSMVTSTSRQRQQHSQSIHPSTETLTSPTSEPSAVTLPAKAALTPTQCLKSPQSSPSHPAILSSSTSPLLLRLRSPMIAPRAFA